MTPKEKARELIRAYKDVLPRMDYQVLNDTSKQCALLAVDEVLYTCEQMVDSVSKKWCTSWWNSVKKEIEKL